MKKLLLLGLLSGLSLALHAAPAEFSKADADKDGVLSTEEAKKALPEVVIVDANNDGMLNKEEIESAVPGLAFTGDKASKEAGLIGKREYEMIVGALEKSKS